MWYIHHQADVYVNINKTLNRLRKTNCLECAIGQIRYREPIQRSKLDLFYMPYSILSHKIVWPPYMNGPLMIFTNTSLQILFPLIGKVHPQFWLDDVYVGLLISHTNIKLIELGLGHFYGDPNITLETANYYYAVHELYPSELYYLTHQ